MNAGSIWLIEMSLCAAVPNVLRGLQNSVSLTSSRCRLNECASSAEDRPGTYAEAGAWPYTVQHLRRRSRGSGKQKIPKALYGSFSVLQVK